MISFQAKILRKQPDLPRYIVVKPEVLGDHKAAFAAKVRLADGPEFERNVRPWGKGSDAFFFNLTQQHCAKSGVETGDVVAVRIQVLDRS